MNLDIRPLLQPSYWLSMNPPTVWEGAGRFLIVVFIGMIIASVVIRRKKLPHATDRHEANLYRRICEMLSTMGFIAVILFFFSFEQIRLLGARFLYLIWIAGLVTWIVTIMKYNKAVIPGLRSKEKDRREKEKYLPKRRK